MLASVDEDRLDLGMTLHLTHERRDFREIGTGTHYIDDFQSAAHGLGECVSEVRSIAFEFRRFGALE